MAKEKRNTREQIFGAEENSAAKLDPEKRSRFRRVAGRMYHTPVLSAKEIAMPALASAGRQVSDFIASSYRTYFFVSVLRIDMLYVTLVMTLLGIFNALIRPVMGIAYDKTRTRWGKARPYVTFAPIFYFGATAVMFCGRLFFDNDITDDPRKILFIFVTMLLRDTFSLIYKIPVDNYLPLMTPNPKDRMTTGLWQTYARKWVGNFFAFLFVPLLDLARSGYLKASLGTVFAGFGFFTAFIGIFSSMLMAAHCPERIMLQPKPAATSKALFYILKNKYMLRNFIANLAGGWWSRGGYDWWVVTQLEIFGGAVRTWPWVTPREITGVISLSLVEPFKKLFGGSYRKTVIFMRLWDLILGSAPAFIGLSRNVIGSWWKAGLVYSIFQALITSNDAPSTVLEGEIGREISDYTEYMTGERPDGSIGLITQLAEKVTDPLKALMTIAVFKWSGYDPNIGSNRRWSQDLVRENSSMYSKAFFLLNLADIVPAILNMIPLLFYDLEGKKKEEMYAALNERRAMIAKESAASAEMEAMVEAMAGTGA